VNERAGWRTVSFSEIDPYASAVLAQRWPGVPNLGDVVQLDRRESESGRGSAGTVAPGREWTRASLWTGGFPCQDLSVAGKRRGMVDGTRSNLAFAFLELVGRHQPRFILLENVPGLLSSHGGRDMARLLGEMVELGYGVGYRTLDARYFGVPQRRRRVFILGDSLGGRAGAERAAEVLSVGSRCRRHPPAGVEAGEGVADRTSAGAVLAREGNGPGHNYLSPSPDSGRVREADGLARGPHDRDGLADTLRVGGRASGAGDSYDNTPWVVNALDQRRGGADDNEAQAGHLVAYTKSHNVDGAGNAETWVSGRVIGESSPDDPLLPLGLDSHRYRCCGNGVVSDVAEWIGLRLAGIIAAEAAA